MIFDWTGLHNQRYFILQQKPNPLKHCNYALPFPMPIGLPFMPCDLPNQYQLISTDEQYKQKKQTYLVFEQQTSFINRFFLPASHRPFSMVSKDYYHHIPYRAFRQFNKCFSSEDRPMLQIFFQDRYIGRVVQKTILNCCCSCDIFGGNQNFQQILVFDQRDQIIYRVVSKKGQKGQFMILPCWNFDTIKYYIIEENRKSKKQRQRIEMQRKKKKLNQGDNLNIISNRNNGQKNEKVESQKQFSSKRIDQMKDYSKKIDQNKNKIRNLQKKQKKKQQKHGNYSQLDEQQQQQYQKQQYKEDQNKNQIKNKPKLKEQDQQQQQQQQQQDNKGQIVGQITHLFNGFSQYTSKNDKYGITLPQDATQEQKCLLIHSVLLIDYILFQNF